MLYNSILGNILEHYKKYSENVYYMIPFIKYYRKDKTAGNKSRLNITRARTADRGFTTKELEGIFWDDGNILQYSTL